MQFIVLIISAAFALMGAAMVVRGSDGGWMFVLVGALPGVVVLFSLLIDRIHASQEYRYSIELTSDEVVCRRSDGELESVRWNDLKTVSAYGAHLEGFTLLFNGTSSGCAVPGSADGIDRFLRHMRSLPGFDYEGITAAAMSQNREEYICWERDSSKGRTEQALGADSTVSSLYS
jgi:hypothetical protein